MPSEAPPSPAPPAAAPAPAPTAAAPPAKPVSPMERARQSMRATAVQADLEAPDPIKTIKQPEPPKPTEIKPEPPKSAEAKAPEKPAETTPPEAKPTDDKKASPWKLLDQFKTRVATLERELLETKAKVPDETTSKRFEAAQKRATELEEEIRYVNYAKSQEFAEKYQKPYEEAWAKAIGDLTELQVTLEDGTSRKADAKDLLMLANMPLGQARTVANQMFGDAADDVMAHRRRVIDLSDAQNKALTEARKAGDERQQKAVAAHAEVAKLWGKFIAEDADKLDWLKPKEGDDEHNAKLEKAMNLVDGSFAQSATDPKLTPEQRAEVVRKHAAVRNRAIAYSTLRLELTRLKKQLDEKDKELKQYQASAPTNGTAGGRTPEQQTPSNPMERAKASLRKSAVPMPAGTYF